MRGIPDHSCESLLACLEHSFEVDLYTRLYVASIIEPYVHITVVYVPFPVWALLVSRLASGTAYNPSHTTEVSFRNMAEAPRKPRFAKNPMQEQMEAKRKKEEEEAAKKAQGAGTL